MKALETMIQNMFHKDCAASTDQEVYEALLTYTKEQLAELSLAADMGLDISKMGNPKFSANELSEIRERLQLGVFKEYKVSSREMTIGTKTGTKPTGRTRRTKTTK